MCRKYRQQCPLESAVSSLVYADVQFHTFQWLEIMAAYLHHLIEAMRLSFADTRWYVTDPEHSDIPLGGMLSKSYAKARRDLISPDAAVVDPVKGAPADYSDTVYFSVVDGDGNACSFINSNYMGFGSGIVPEGCGFTLQNRASKMPLDPEHPNVLAPNKRPYVTTSSRPLHFLSTREH